MVSGSQWSVVSEEDCLAVHRIGKGTTPAVPFLKTPRTLPQPRVRLKALTSH